ncbi:hypothetical protein CVE24_03000, partial [Pseudomonas syringae pv. actinidiae]|nr:hypothetical protein [Pseudomonas syringae pv. actinidiae]
MSCLTSRWWVVFCESAHRPGFFACNWAVRPIIYWTNSRNCFYLRGLKNRSSRFEKVSRHRFGGQSSEHEVSLQSARNVINAIDRESYALTLIGVDKLGRWLRFDEADYLLNANDPARIKLSGSGKQLS